MSPDQVITAIVSVAGALGLRELLAGAIAYVTGRAGRERSRVADLMRERDAAEAELDAADAYRRKVEEFASQVVRAFYLAGGKPSELPAWPRPPVTPDDPSGNNGTSTREEGVPHA